MNEIIVRFKNEDVMKSFIGQMVDGFGGNYCDFTHWTEDENGHYSKQYDKEGRLICTVNKFFDF